MPKVGLLSDTHGYDDTARAGASILRDNGAELLLHLGDLGSTEVLDALAEMSLPVRVVFGNTDHDTRRMTEHAATLGVTVDHPMGWIELPGGDLVFLHGDNPDDVRTALAAKVRYLCHGHTHIRLDGRRGKTRVINPGALHRAREYSVALLDTDADRLTFYPVPRPC